MSITVRRIRADEWRRARDLRLEALRDEAAPIAFLDRHDDAAARADDFWQDRAEYGAAGDDVAQFIASDAGDWVGSATVLRRETGETDHHGRVLTAARGDVVGVFVRESHRGQGVIDALLDAAASWARTIGDRTLTLDVHADNVRAQAAYRRAGFAETGLNFTGAIGAEIEMARPLSENTAVTS